MTERLDQAMLLRGLTQSRAKAKEAIEAGAVTVNGRPIQKPSMPVRESDEITLSSALVCRYVGRGGLKLEYALDFFKVDPEGKIAVDIGASTGGFTDCLLQRGASRVYAVDSGTMQLAEKLVRDPRVTVMEKYNARFLSAADFDESPALAVMDVSFISQTLIHAPLARLLKIGGEFITLIKPQFEAGRSALTKKGIVKDEKDRKAAIEKVVASAEACGFSHIATVQSPIFGGDGNIEYLAYFQKTREIDG